MLTQDIEQDPEWIYHNYTYRQIEGFIEYYSWQRRKMYGLESNKESELKKKALEDFQKAFGG